MIIKKHNVIKWFGSNAALLTYFENDFDKNTIGPFKAPASTVKRFNNLATDADKEKLAARIGNIFIDAIVSSSKGQILTSVDFDWLLTGTKEYLKDAVCEAIQHAVLNRQVWEKVNASSISTPNFSTNVDSTNWVLSNDMFGMIAKNAIKNSGLSHYQIVGDGFVGRVAYEDAQGEVVLYKWNDYELGKELSAADHMGIEYANFSDAIAGINAYVGAGGIVDKYDYMYVTMNNERALLRFEGGTWTNFDNWERKDIQEIKGERYLVYKNYVIAGSGSKAGTANVDLSGYITRVEANIAFPHKADVYTKTETYNRQEIDAKSGSIPWITDTYANVAEFGSKAPMDTIVKSDTNADGTPNTQGFVFLIKTAGGIKQIRTWEEVKVYIDNIKTNLETDVATNKSDITATNVKVDKNASDIVQLASEIQVIENTWKGDHLMSSSGTADLSTLTGDKGAFDFTAGKKLIVSVGPVGHSVTDTQVLKVGEQGSYHVIGEGVDATFGITIATSGVATIQNFASTGTTDIAMTDLRIKEIEQNPKSTAVIDAYTKQESDGRYQLKGALPEFTSAKELYDSMETGTPINNADTKHINADTAGEIIKNQHEINRLYLSEFADKVYFMNDKTMEYRDSDLDLVTLDATITTTGAGPTTVAYDSLISPYDRIAQDQASFLATMFQDSMKIQYLFTSKGKAIRFSGNTNSTYKWETVTKFNTNGTSAKYIKFTGTATLEINDSALSPTGLWIKYNMPYEVPLSDFMDDSNRTAIVTMNFASKPNHGSQVASIDYKTSAHFYAQREEALFKSLNDYNNRKFEGRIYDFTASPLTHTKQTQGAHNYFILDKPAAASDTVIGSLNKIVIKKPTSGEVIVPDSQITYGTDLIWLNKSQTNILNWSEIQSNVNNGYTLVIKRLPNDEWEFVRWEQPPVDTYGLKQEDVDRLHNFKGVGTVTGSSTNVDELHLPWYIDTAKNNVMVWDRGPLNYAPLIPELKKTLTIEFSDGTSEDFKVG